jgi:2-oxoglutarate ferredoxin oxidoreductase subunit delta
MDVERSYWIINKNRCKKCRLCINLCPAEALEEGEDGFPFLVEEDKCRRCGLCERWCPDFAIKCGGAVSAKSN